MFGLDGTRCDHVDGRPHRIRCTAGTIESLRNAVGDTTRYTAVRWRQAQETTAHRSRPIEMDATAIDHIDLSYPVDRLEEVLDF